MHIARTNSDSLRDAASNTKDAYDAVFAPLLKCAAEHPIAFNELFRQVAEEETLGDVTGVNSRALHNFALIGILQVRKELLDAQLAQFSS